MEPPQRIAGLWTIAVDGNHVRAELWTHPHGCELRIIWDGDFSHGQVHRTAAAALADARATLSRLRRYERSSGKPEDAGR